MGKESPNASMCKSGRREDVHPDEVVGARGITKRARHAQTSVRHAAPTHLSRRHWAGEPPPPPPPPSPPPPSLPSYLLPPSLHPCLPTHTPSRTHTDTHTGTLSRIHVLSLCLSLSLPHTHTHYTGKPLGQVEQHMKITQLLIHGLLFVACQNVFHFKRILVYSRTIFNIEFSLCMCVMCAALCVCTFTCACMYLLCIV